MKKFLIKWWYIVAKWLGIKPKGIQDSFLGVILNAMIRNDKWRHLAEAKDKLFSRYYIDGNKLPSKAVRRLKNATTISCWCK